MAKEKLEATGFIRRAKHESHFFVQNNDTVQNTHLSFAAKGLLSYFLSNNDNWTIRKTWLYAHFPDGRRKVTHAFEELKSHGYIVEKTVRDSKGKFKGYNYEVHEVPLFTKTPIVQNEQSGCIKPNPIAQNPQSDNPQSGNPQSDNEHLINTKNTNEQLKIKTKENKEALSQFFENDLWPVVVTKTESKIEAFNEYKKAVDDILKEKPELDINSILFWFHKRYKDYLKNNELDAQINNKPPTYIKQLKNWFRSGLHRQDFETDRDKIKTFKPVTRMQTKIARYIPEERPDDYL